MQHTRRILCLWFPRLAAEQVLRHMQGTINAPFAVVAEVGNSKLLHSLSSEASGAGLRAGQPLRDAMAMCPDLDTRLRAPQAEMAFMHSLRRWAEKFTPWAAITGDQDDLVLDITGCAHLFGGEEALCAAIDQDCARFGLTVRMGLADTLGAAWALAHYAGQTAQASRSGDAIDQEAYATRARAVKRRNWERGGAAPKITPLLPPSAPIAAPGQTRRMVARLPIAALRLDDKTVTELNRVGLRRISDLLDQPRAPLQRRFGTRLGLRLDQILGLVAEPINPARAAERFSCRMTLPDPIGLQDDIEAALARMLPVLCRKLHRAGRGARRLRLEAYRSDQTSQWIEVGLARPAYDTHRIQPLLSLKLPELDAGFGIDLLRLVVTVHEPVHPDQLKQLSQSGAQGMQTALDDLIGRLGTRVTQEAITRLHPAASHIPEKTTHPVMAAYAPAEYDWTSLPQPRPLVMFPPELVSPHAALMDAPDIPLHFRWRGRDYQTTRAEGPERIAPEWWLDDPHWRSGTRDYWRMSTQEGAELWLYYAHGATLGAGWFCHGVFA